MAAYHPAASPAAWLRERGYNPDGDLCESIPDKHHSWISRTAIFAAVEAGELGVCRFIWEHTASMIRSQNTYGNTPMYQACRFGLLDVASWLLEAGAGPDTRTQDNSGYSPMLLACQNGKLDVAKWLYNMGAAEDIRTKNHNGVTPMLSACTQCHLSVSKWLFQVGAAEDIRTQDKAGNTPMLIVCSKGLLDIASWLFEVGAAEDIRVESKYGDFPLLSAFIRGHLGVAKWLILQGSASNDEGCVDAAMTMLLARRNSKLCAQLLLDFQMLIREHSNFVTVLIATRFSESGMLQNCAASAAEVQSNAYRPVKAQGGRALSVLRGHEGGILRLVADFAGLVRGRQLRNARGAAAILRGYVG